MTTHIDNLSPAAYWQEQAMAFEATIQRLRNRNNRIAKKLRSVADNLSPNSNVYPASEMRKWATALQSEC